jgi:nucleoside-diphosphate-sugar epimerase
MKRKAFVTGANGFIGSHLIRYLLHNQYDVHALVRKTSNLQSLTGLKIRYYFGDLFSDRVIRSGIEDCNYIFHCAAVLEDTDVQNFYRVNGEGTKKLIRIVQNCNSGLKRFLHVSSIAVFGPARKGVLVTEDAPLNPVSHYGKSKREAEEAVRESRLNWTIVRPTNVLGTGQKELFRIVKMLRSGFRPKLGKREAQTTICFIDDLVRGMTLSAESERSLHKTYIIAGPEAYGFQQLVDCAAEILGRSAYIPLPFYLIYFAALSSKIHARIMKKKSFIDPEKIRQTRSGYWVQSPELIRRELGFQTLIPLEQGIREIIDYYERHNWRLYG